MCVFLQSLQFYHRGRKRLTWEDKGRATEWVSPRPQNPAVRRHASCLLNLEAFLLLGSPHRCEHMLFRSIASTLDRTHQMTWKQYTLSCTTMGLMQRHHTLEQKGRALAVKGLWASSMGNYPETFSFPFSSKCPLCKVFPSQARMLWNIWFQGWLESAQVGTW